MKAPGIPNRDFSARIYSTYQGTHDGYSSISGHAQARVHAAQAA
ncbi:MAG: hypothetical protein PF501_10000 [Salinisphaera sp.]|nr:hypothetical protein [Salinisphaera sp.]